MSEKSLQYSFTWGSNNYKFVVRRVPLLVQGKIYPTCFIVLPTQKVDIILGMNWMEEQGVLLDILSQTVHINSALHGPMTVYLRNCTSLAQSLN